MDGITFGAVLGVVFLIAFFIERASALSARHRRERERRREAVRMTHLVGAKKWWKEDDEIDEDF